VPHYNAPQQAMLEEVIYQSKQTPGHKYDADKSLDRVKFHKPIYYKMRPENKSPESGIKPKKSKEPDVGTYEPFKAFMHTQTKSTERNGYKMLKTKITPFTLIEAQAKKGIPGVGHYKNKEKGLDNLSKSPTSLRIKRH
jgi:hypothetical protein